MSSYLEKSISSLWNENILNLDSNSIEELLKKIKLSTHGFYMPKINEIPMRPIILDSNLLQKIKLASKRLVQLSAEAAYLMSGGDPLKLREQFGISPETDPLFSNHPLARRLATQIARPDFIISDGKIKFIEMNIHTAIGGLQICSTLPEAYLNSSIARNIRKNNLLFTETPIAAFADLIKDIASELAITQNVNIGFFEWDYDVEEINWYIGLLRAYGLNAIHVNPDFIEVREDGYIYFENQRIDIGMRLFSLSSLEFPDDIIHVKKLMEGHLKGSTLMLPCETTSIFSNKKILAYLSEHSYLFPPEDQKIIDDYLPWTRNLSAGSHHHPEWGLLNLELIKKTEFQNKLVLKSGDGEQGNSVYIGCEMDNSQWIEKINFAMSQNSYILQEYIVPDLVKLPFYEPDKQKIQIEDSIAVFGTYVIGNQSGVGVLSRIAKSKANGLVLNYARGATLSIVLFS